MPVERMAQRSTVVQEKATQDIASGTEEEHFLPSRCRLWNLRL